MPVVQKVVVLTLENYHKRLGNLNAMNERIRQELLASQANFGEISSLLRNGNERLAVFNQSCELLACHLDNTEIVIAGMADV